MVIPTAAGLARPRLFTTTRHHHHHRHHHHRHHHHLFLPSLLLISSCLLILPCGGAGGALRHASSTLLTSQQQRERLPPVHYPFGELTYGHAGPERRKQFSRQRAPGWRCLSCEDVVQTWRDTYRCAGNADADKVLTARDIWDYGGCHAVGMCSALKALGPAQVSNCEETEKAMTTGSRAKFYYEKAGTALAIQPSDQKDGYDTQMLQFAEKKYEVCSEFCNPDARDCFDVLTSQAGDCRLDARCPKLLENPGVCQPVCISCFWLIEGLPQFEEICKMGIFETDTTYPGDGQFRKYFPKEQRGTLKIGSQVVPKPPTAEAEAAFKPQVGLGSQPLEIDGPLFAMPNQMGQDPDSKEKPKIAYAQIKNVCYDMWKEFERDVQARYMVQYVDNLGSLGEWNAHTVCQCLKKCPYDEFQALDLLPACSDMINTQASEDVLKESLFPDNAMTFKPDRVYGDPPGGKLAKESHMVSTFNYVRGDPSDYKGFRPSEADMASAIKYKEAPKRTDPFKPTKQLMDELDRT